MGAHGPATGHGPGEHGRARIRVVQVERTGHLQRLVGEAPQGGPPGLRPTGLHQQGGVGKGPEEGAQAGQRRQLGRGPDQQQPAPGLDVRGEQLQQPGHRAAPGQHHHAEAGQPGEAGGHDTGELDLVHLPQPLGAQDLPRVAAEAGPALTSVDDQGHAGQVSAGAHRAAPLDADMARGGYRLPGGYSQPDRPGRDRADLEDDACARGRWGGGPPEEHACARAPPAGARRQGAGRREPPRQRSPTRGDAGRHSGVGPEPGGPRARGHGGPERAAEAPEDEEDSSGDAVKEAPGRPRAAVEVRALRPPGARPPSG